MKPIYAKIRGQKQKFIKINLEETFPGFAPRSGGDFFQKSKLTIESINETIPAINLLIENLHNFSRAFWVLSMKSQTTNSKHEFLL